jgi:hypothetical protein
MSASLVRAFRQRWVINLRTTKTWGMKGWATLSSENISNTAVMAAGGGHQSLGELDLDSSNQSFGSRKATGAFPRGLLSESCHQEVTQGRIFPQERSFAPKWKGTKDRGLEPGIIIRLP